MYQTAGVQLIAAAASLLILLTAALAWFVDWVVQRRRGNVHANLVSRTARWVAVGLGLLNTVLLGWLLASLLGMVDTFVFPTITVTLLTWLFWINVPGVIALLIFAALAWKNRYWQTTWRFHYTVVALATVVFVAFLVNWNLLAGL